MAQVMFLPTPSIPGFCPNSPDPTPLRMLAFSVAEAALQSHPSSPNIGVVDPRDAKVTQEKRNPRWSGGDWSSAWSNQTKTSDNLWDLVERAKERKASPPPDSDASSPPVSPATYNFVLPANSQLAASVAQKLEPTRRPTHLQLSLQKRLPLFTRSAEPSPTKSTFSSLDQTRPPPVFKPRLSAEEFSSESRHVSATRHTRTKSDDLTKQQPKTVPRPRAKLPSLAQIQAKMQASPGQVPQPRVARTNSDDSVEILVTPTEERPSLAILARRPATPPSMEKEKEAKLASFLRARTSGRLAMATPPRPARPALKVTPPSFETRPALPPLHLFSPTEGRLSPSSRTNLISPTDSRFEVSTPPARSPSRLEFSPRSTSVTDSPRSAGTASPTLSVPIITCTPAPQKVLRDGVEQESDEEEDDVVVFAGAEMEELDERDEREKRAQQMKDRLKLRRRSD